MRQAVIASGQNRAQPDAADPAQTEPMPIAMGGKMVVNQRRQFHPLHLFEQQGNVVDALGDNILDVIAG
jgi:hypothetical protein